DLVSRVQQSTHRSGVVLVASELSPEEVRNAILAGARGLLRRGDAFGERLVSAIFTVAAGDCTVPSDVVDRILDGSETTRERTEPGLCISDREQRVLILLADGRETEEIARELNYSARTVTSIIHGITQRFGLRNRAHAVAYALQGGLL